MEKYSQSPEEIAKAENMMSPYQRETSLEREDTIDAWKKLGIEGHLEISRFNPDQDAFKEEIDGEINKHKIHIEIDAEAKTGKIVVDGFELTPEEAEKFYEKYADIMPSFALAPSLLEMVEEDAKDRFSHGLTGEETPPKSEDSEEEKKIWAKRAVRNIYLKALVGQEKVRTQAIKDLGV